MGLSKTYLNNIEKAYSASRLSRLQIKNEDNIKARMQRLKKEMTEIAKEHKYIKAGLREVRNKIKEIRSDCAQLREETKHMFDQSRCIKRRLDIMFHILQARQRGDFIKAQKLTQFLCMK
ncbi:uncharacterized protein LOC120003215 [Tripterygium wilfordii]|uniref:uncharacterized protein LOC120003215 n=1 Tax=Tripterygium wilfordii TaxID=458696 RepID=UPI0018F7EFCF|nr:uncharacterized protein LOC120003215 [Tripterygium wilfordii]